jgi:hypothetical protein
MVNIWEDGAYYPLGCAADDMSEGEYQAMCDEATEELLRSPSSLNESYGRWRTRDGRVLKIVDMSTDHLVNAIRYFAEWNDHSKILELREELRARTAVGGQIKMKAKS